LRVFNFREYVNVFEMHEIRIAEDLSGIVLEAAVKEKLSKVICVNITFGQMVQIVPDIFRFAFEEIVRDTIVQGAEINIEVLPVKMKCRNCANEFLIADNTYSCKSCSSVDLDIMQGKEIFIKSIEGE
jgi:hydrogenase nickel incorporation protein HypA/HybF